MTVLVVGGAGYIGSHVCKALKKAGYNPVVFDHFLYGHEWAVRWGPAVKGDIHDSKTLDDTFKKFQPKGVIHLASYLNVRESQVDPAKYYHNNFMGTLSLLEAMKRNGVTTLVFSSTAAVYGTPTHSPIEEAHPKHPINPYGRSKWMVEELLKDFGAAHGFSSISLRYFNASGADPDLEIGEAHHPETHLIPLALLAILKQKPPLTLYGIDHPTPDGTPIRDYIHVSDLSVAHVQSLELLFNNPQTLSLNLGTGSGYSVKQVLTTIQKVTGSPVPFTYGPRSPSDPPVLVADSRKARFLLNWKPCYSELETIVKTAWDWHRK